MERLDVTVRQATADDHSMLFLLAEENLHPLAERAGHPERFDGAGFLAMLAHAEVYVAENPVHEIAGYVAFDDEGDDVAVRCVCVSPAHEAQAVANRLVDWVEGLAFNRGRQRLTAFVPADDETSLRLYRRHDFTTWPAEDRPEMVVLEKRLPEG
jgi:ribosomal protein S18 acetylase RimI-like enzyme